MTEIKPFKAVHYNVEKVPNISKVVCPPYDVISPLQLDAYYLESEHNFVRVMLAKEEPNDDRSNNKYTRSKQVFQKWLQDGILVEDERPCIYFYKQEYRILGQRHSRTGFISLMKVQDEKDGRVLPHEKIHEKPKEDRLRLWKTLSANLSSIFVCFSDKEKKVEKIFRTKVATQPPFIEATDEDGVKHTLWRLEDEDAIKEIAQLLFNQRLFIADGHHRYEVAKELRRAKRSSSGSNNQKAYDYVMTYFTNMESRDLKIFPVHRVITKIPKPLDFLDEYFRIDKVKTVEDLVILLAKAGKNEQAFGLYTKDGIKLLRLKHKDLIDKLVPEGSSAFRRLDATILKYFILDRVGVQSDDILYTKDVHEATGMVDRAQADAAFIMNAVTIQQLKDIALNGEKMPPKTTYFYPKVLSGLTVYKMG